MRAHKARKMHLLPLLLKPRLLKGEWEMKRNQVSIEEKFLSHLCLGWVTRQFLTVECDDT